MITCPWCGTHYQIFQPNCQNCGGPLPLAEEKSTPTLPPNAIPTPPPAPRPVPKSYVWRLLFTDGWSIAAFILGLVGFIFSLVGAGLTIGVLTAFVGIPFLLLGLALLGAGIWVFVWRYQNALKIVNVLREGEATRGQITELQENYSVTINGHHPWLIQYQFQCQWTGPGWQGNRLEPARGTVPSRESGLYPVSAKCSEMELHLSAPVK